MGEISNSYKFWKRFKKWADKADWADMADRDRDQTLKKIKKWNF